MAINILYKFRGVGKPLFTLLSQDPSIISSPFSLADIEAIIPFRDTAFVQYLYKKLPLPISYHYLKTFGWVFFRSNLGQTAFMLNQYSDQGWWYYFPLVLLLKSNIIFLVSLVVLPTIFFSQRVISKKIRSLLFIPMFFITCSMGSGINTGIRLIFPAIPILIIIAGTYLSTILKRKWYLIYFLVTVQLLTNIKLFPNYLGYMNFLAGQTKQHFKILADSNLDWGARYQKICLLSTNTWISIDKNEFIWSCFT